MDKLPYEVLIHIFSYLGAEDLVEVQKVNIYWKDICQSQGSNMIWKNVIYAPSFAEKESQIERVLQQSPRLQAFLPIKGLNTNFLRIILKYCPDIKRLKLYPLEMFKSDFKDLFKGYPLLEDLDVSVAECIDGPYYDWIKNCVGLKKLRLRGHEPVRISLLRTLADTHPRMKVLDIQYFFCYTSTDLQYLLNEVHFEHLKISVTVNNKTWLFTILESCTDLEILTLNHYREEIKTDFMFLKNLHKLKKFIFHCRREVVSEKLAPLYSDPVSSLLKGVDLVIRHDP